MSIKIGLDLSTVVCGVALSDNNTLLEATALDISKNDDYDFKSGIIISKLNEFINKYKNNTFEINIESALNAFSYGRSNTLTIIKLIKTNAVISYILSKTYPNIKVNYINMNTARKQIFGKARIKGIKSKVFVKEMIETIHPEIKKFYLPIPTRSKKENKMNEDIRDAVVMSLVI